MEARYLKENLSCLSTCLKEVAEKRPHDPIEYIAFWLKKHIANEKYRIGKEEEAKRLEREREEDALEQKRRAIRLEEARRLSEEEAARLKEEEERRQREAASASKLPVVEEKEEPLPESDTAQPDGEKDPEVSAEGTTEDSSAEVKEDGGDSGETTEGGEAGEGGEGGEGDKEEETTEKEEEKAEEEAGEETAAPAEES